MEKIINGKTYYIPSNLTIEQERIYCHIIDWKREHLTTERGTYKGNEYDALFPTETEIPTMLYPAVVEQWKDMQNSPFGYKFHKFANHAVSSQTACVNLFLPLLLSDKIDEILPNIPGCPSNLKRIARDKLYHGFCFEYWGQDILQGKGMLKDHSAQAGTDADVAIAYYDANNQLCVWLIEHKLSEKEFTKCGGYDSKANDHKEDCKACSMSIISANPSLCHYTSIGYNYWEIFNSEKNRFNEQVCVSGCPFREGLNQLWRNQLLGFALKNNGYHTATFSVCHHAKNTMLNKSINLYKELVNNEKYLFNTFTNDDVMKTVKSEYSDLLQWKKWYLDLYCF